MRQHGIPTSNAAESALDGLAPIGRSDSERFVAAAEAAGVISWSHFFPYLHFSGKPEANHRLLHEFVDDAALVYRLEIKKGWPRLSLLLAPFPFSLPALRQARDRMDAFHGPGQGRIVRLQESEALLVARQGFEIFRHSDEYIYDADAIARLEGSSFSTLRRKIARFAGSSVTVREYLPSDETACQALLDFWRTDLKASGVRIRAILSLQQHLSEGERGLFRG